MTPSLTHSIVLGLLALAPLADANVARATAPNLLVQEAKPDRYVRSSSAAKLTNVADPKGVAVASVPAGTLLAVYGEQAGWLSVEPPQGLNVWVFGRFLRGTAQSGVAEVTGDGVRMRPKPSSTVDSFPLEQQLHEGDRVRVLARHEPTKPLVDDWVQIVTPPGVRGWIRATETAPIESGLDTRSAWMDAVKKSTAAVALIDLKSGGSVGAGNAGVTAGSAGVSTGSAGAPAGSAGAPAGSAGAAAGGANGTPANPDAAPAQNAWETAERAYETAKSAGSAEWKSVRAQFERYIAANPTGAHTSTAQLRLEQISYHEEIARLKSDAALQESQRQKLLTDAQAQLEEASLAQDPLWGRFQARGWLRQDEEVPGRFYVQWAGRTASEVTCASGRYDLAMFAGAEIGVQGAMTRSAGSVDRPMRIDATRIEILSAPTGR